MQCDELVRTLSDFMDGELDEATRRRAREHLATCPHCPVVLRTTRATIRLYREALAEGMPPASRARMLERLRAAAERV